MFEPGQPVGIGFVVSSPRLTKPLAVCSILPPEVLSQMKPRMQYITQAESCAAVLPLLLEPDLFADSDLIHFVDNQGTLSTLIRGAARDGDLSVLSALYQLTCARLGTRAWLEYVEPEANVAVILRAWESSGL